MNPIERARVGNTWVTRLGLGLAPIGGLYSAVSEEQAFATVERGWDLGIRYFDVAPLYGNGLTEKRAGHVLSRKKRSDFVLSTKVGRLLRPGHGEDQGIWAESADVSPVFDFSAPGVLSSYAESLHRLGLDRADIVHLHDPDDHFEAASTQALPQLVTMREEGRIGAVSAGMNQAAMLADFVRTGQLDSVLLAGRYTLLDRSGADELLPLCLSRGVSVIAAGVFNSGLLADPSPNATFDYAPVDRATLDRALGMQRICAEYRVPLRAAALQFPFRHPAVTCVLVGVRSPEEVEDAVKMATLPIPEELWKELDA
ncbi:aldo/keto reductase [Paractinoplanes atraurantiacus]|uniref:D-threo-aldose 1-dehydrogenase n=1 Tax=Paractinoplanes atraurantiacus TaxID=1036182 RepID=A0A285I4B8_9ACTN|nr:aldo/keto reductase [Actinoplanes atraurantiacus]SNY42784.1 D-threo-aldose 1-dehydrogenase [Actinoplanes atraurantiacus]